MLTKFVMGGLLLTASLFTTTVQAQQTAPSTNQQMPQMPQGGRRMGGMGGYQAADPATRAQRMTDQLTKQLNLDEATSKKVYDLALARDQQIDAIQKSTDDNKTKDTKLKANADDFKAKMQGVLTADQFQQFQAMRQRGGRGNGAPRPDNNNNNN